MMKTNKGYLHIMTMKAQISLAFCIVFFFQAAVFCHCAEANFWLERRNQLAQLPNRAVPFPFVDEIENKQALSHERMNLKEGDLSQTGLPQWIYNAVSPTAHIQEVHLSTRPRAKTVLLMQDAHLHHEAQRNIAAAVTALSKALIERSSSLVVGLEGSDAPAADYSPYTSIPERQALREVAEAFLQNNLINGVELAAIGFQGERDRGPVTLPFQVVGVENQSEYDANVRAFLDSLPHRDLAKTALREFKHALLAKKAELYSDELKRYDRETCAYAEGRLALPEYLEYLASISQASFPETKRLIDAYALERSINFGQVEAERAEFLKQLMNRLDERDLKKLLSMSLAIQKGRASMSSYYEGLKSLSVRKGVSWARYPAFDLYVRYVLAGAAVNSRALWNEIPLLEQEVESRLARTPGQKTLCRLTRELHLLSKLSVHSLTENEWLQLNMEMHPDRLGEGLSAINVLMPESMREMAPHWKSFQSFYAEAVRRNKTIAAKMAVALQDRPGATGLLVVGGFHSSGVVEELKAKGLSVILMSPQITAVDQNALSSLDMLAEARLPLDRLFAGERLFLPVQPVASTASPALAPARRELAESVQALTRAVERGGTGRSDSGNFVATLVENQKPKHTLWRRPGNGEASRELRIRTGSKEKRFLLLKRKGARDVKTTSNQSRGRKSGWKWRHVKSVAVGFMGLSFGMMSKTAEGAVQAASSLVDKAVSYVPDNRLDPAGQFLYIDKPTGAVLLIVSLFITIHMIYWLTSHMAQNIQLKRKHRVQWGWFGPALMIGSLLVIDFYLAGFVWGFSPKALIIHFLQVVGVSGAAMSIIRSRSPADPKRSQSTHRTSDAETSMGADMGREEMEKVIVALNKPQNGPVLKKIFRNPNSKIQLTYSLGGMNFRDGKIAAEPNALLPQPSVETDPNEAEALRRFADALESPGTKWFEAGSDENLQKSGDMNGRSLGVVDLSGPGMDLTVVADLYRRSGFKTMPAVLMTEEGFNARLEEALRSKNEEEQRTARQIWSAEHRPLFLAEATGALETDIDSLVQLLKRQGAVPSSLVLFTNRALTEEALRQFVERQIMINLVQVFTVQIEEGGVGARVKKAVIYALMA